MASLDKEHERAAKALLKALTNVTQEIDAGRISSEYTELHARAAAQLAAAYQSMRYFG